MFQRLFRREPKANRAITEALYGQTDVGTGQADEDVRLSTLVGKLNERFGTEFTPADQLFFDQVRETAVANFRH